MPNPGRIVANGSYDAQMRLNKCQFASHVLKENVITI